MTPEERIYNADRAREVLKNEAFHQVFEDYKTEITEQWMKSPARDPAGRESCWLMLSMLNRIEALLKKSLEDGQMARVDLQHKKSLAERAKGLIGME